MDWINNLMTLNDKRILSVGYAAVLLSILLLPNAYAAPFTTCPSQAFLFQGDSVSTYGVNLVTGSYSVLADDSGVEANINGLGFDQQDRYLYGFNTTHLQMVRMGGDFQAETLNLSGLPESISFYAGDVFNHYYYLYRRNKGLYKVDLSPLDEDVDAVLTAELVSTNSSVNIADFAFHPNNNMIYAVDNIGVLYQIDPETGSTLKMGDTGETGAFGAMYFDVNGYFYLSRNRDGHIYRIDLSSLQLDTSDEQLSSLDVSAVKFADGPISSKNDGARCASAPLIDVDTLSNIDFGDAPESYATMLADNGPRHLLDGQTYLGLTSPDGDYDGYIGADSDDSSLVNQESYDDEDGVNFVSAFEIGLDSVISVYASTDGILSAWFDWNGDGDFTDENEQNIVDISLSAGFNSVVIRVPDDALSGNSWSRFRFSQQTGLNYNGGSSSGEVEDYAISISESELSYRYYPSENGWVTLAYEDQWPVSNDYDMNDVVMHYRTVEVISDQKLVRIDIYGELQALGGSYHNGFAVQLDNIATTNVNSETLRLLHNNIKQQYSGQSGSTTYDILENGNSNAVIMVSQDLWKHVSSDCNFYRSENGCDQAQTFDFEVSIPLIEPLDLADVAVPPYDPFIFATEGYYHGDIFSEQPGRGLEIHLVDHAPTEKFNSSYYGLSDDSSDPVSGRFFRNANNLPWALEIVDTWQWPSERKSVLQAYPKFQEFVESQGEEYSNWFDSSLADVENLF